MLFWNLSQPNGSFKVGLDWRRKFIIGCEASISWSMLLAMSGSTLKAKVSIWLLSVRKNVMTCLGEKFPYGSWCKWVEWDVWTIRSYKTNVMPPAGTIALIEFQEAPGCLSSLHRTSIQKVQQFDSLLGERSKGLSFVNQSLLRWLKLRKEKKWNKALSLRSRQTLLSAMTLRMKLKLRVLLCQFSSKTWTFHYTTTISISIWKVAWFALAIIK